MHKTGRKEFYRPLRYPCIPDEKYTTKPDQLIFMENSVVVLTNLKYTNIWTFSYLFLFGKQEYSNYKKKIQMYILHQNLLKKILLTRDLGFDMVLLFF